MRFEENDPCRLLSIATQLVKSKVDKSLAEIGLTSSQFYIIMSLFDVESTGNQENLSPAELAEEMNCGRPTVTGLIDRLEKQGFVARVPNPKDRRSQKILMTDKARELLDSMEHIFNENKMLALQGFSKQEIVSLQGYLNRIISNLCT